MTRFEKICSLPFAAVVRRATGSVSSYRTHSSLRTSLLATQVQSDDPVVLDRYTTRLHGFLKVVRAVRSLGAPALALAYVSCGWLDAFCEDNMSPWGYTGGNPAD